MSLQYDPVTGELFYPAVRKPRGYCVHKHTFKENKKDETGMLSKLELFAYFKPEVLEKILERTKELTPVKKGVIYPPYFNQPGKYTVLHRAIVMWNKSPVFIKCYQGLGASTFKLEVTRGAVKNVGKKFLQPISTLNSLGGLIKFLTDDTEPISNTIHDDFLWIDEFLKDCEQQFLKLKRMGQLRLMNKQKLRKNLKFGFKIS